ncbi:hypothetical protein FF38_00324 [Lucilia cuprina]|uniref:Sensory neuron membrane protein 1 n=1 Tax=Lucilia cuprina TaxID=7375 RepID=A0A0L0BLE1_LUCCU|nr:hypothetical protein FF38_00324 [Lucilia cuprina]
MKEKIYKNILILCSIFLVVGIVAVIAFPMLMQSMIKKEINLTPNSETRQMWEKFPISIKFSIYVLNVTNHQEVEAGGKPKLQEVGPFVFDEWKDKYDIEDIEAEDAVEFNMRNTFIFRPDLGLSGEELIIMPHPLIQIMAISIKRDKAPMLKMITEGLEEIFKPQSAFIAAPFMDIFYRGFNVDCSSNNFAASAICLNFHTGNVKGGVQYNETMFKFSLLAAEINLKPNSETRQMWEKFPIPVMFSIYVFNITNPQDVENGAKPKLKETGPFVFEEWKDKYDIADISEEDAVEFNMRNTFIFRPDLGLSGEEVITMPHPLIQFVSISIKREKAAMLDMIAQGLQDIFEPKSAFIQAPFMDVFFRGFDVICSESNSFAASAICLNFHTGSVKGARQINETHFKFSLLGASNHSDAGRFKVSRGIKNNRMLGQVLEFEGDEELNVWPGEECNKLKGTDSTIFAPLMKPSEGLWTFSPDLCRSLGPQYQKKVIYNGIPAFRYTMDFGDVKNEPENHCFCKDYPDNCPAKGTMDLSLCNETPMVASMPHFLNADPKLLEDVEGLQPDERKHGIYIDFEIISGTPLSIAKRLQFNLDVEPIEELPVMSKLKPLVMPLFWVEEAVDLDKTFTDLIKSKVFT